jgi:hypothetical protein
VRQERRTTEAQPPLAEDSNPRELRTSWGLRAPAASSTVNRAMISMAHTTLFLTPSAAYGAEVACEPMKLRIDGTPSGV